MTDLGDLLNEPAGYLAALVAAGKVSARELTAAYLARIDGSANSLNAVVALDAPGALEAAGKVDDAVAAGRPLRALAGVPMTVKEAFAVKGLATTAGLEELAGQPAVADAPAVAQLRNAGAIILGKTNVPVQLADFQSANPVYGRTSNPWDLDRTCGGSSGGSAAAVAAGLSALELGSDLSGSIRVPASWCGVYGLRPSNGWISKRAHLPWPLEGLLEPPTSVVGPMGRSVADLALAFEALTGVPSAPRGAASASPASIVGLRIAVWSDSTNGPVDAETAQVLSAVRAALEAAGAVVDDFVAPFDAAEALALGGRLVNAEITHGLSAAQWSAVAKGPSGLLTQLVRSHMADEEQRLRIAAAWDASLGAWDAVLCPATPFVAPHHDATPKAERRVAIDAVSYAADVVGAWSVLASLGHQPSVTLPVGHGGVTGLPVGAQLVGRYRADQELLAVAAAVDEVTDGWRLAPPCF